MVSRIEPARLEHGRCPSEKIASAPTIADQGTGSLKESLVLEKTNLDGHLGHQAVVLLSSCVYHCETHPQAAG